MSTDISLISLIQTGLVLGTTLAWSDVARTGANYIYPNNGVKVFDVQLIYAIILTVIVILIFYFLQHTRKEYTKLKNNIDNSAGILKGIIKT